VISTLCLIGEDDNTMMKSLLAGVVAWRNRSVTAISTKARHALLSEDEE
jgi:hypothetical protein